MDNGTRKVLLTTLVLAVALAACAYAEEVLTDNPGASDIWKHRAATFWVGRLTQDDYADRYPKERRGWYAVAQSFQVSSDATVSSVEVFVGTRVELAEPLTLSLCSDDKGRPGTELVSPDATATAHPKVGRGEFTRFAFKTPVKVEAGKTYWMVFAKGDESGVKNPMYDFSCSAKDDEGKTRNWYEAGVLAIRGPYASPEEPGPWAVHKNCDLYFKVCGEKTK